MRHPLLLGVVTAELSTVVKGPGPDRGEVEAVVAHGHVAPLVVADGHEVTTTVPGERLLVDSAGSIEIQLRPLGDITEIQTVEPQPRDRATKGELPLLVRDRRREEIKGHEQGPVGFDQPLTMDGVQEGALVRGGGKDERHPRGPAAGRRVVGNPNGIAAVLNPGKTVRRVGRRVTDADDLPGRRMPAQGNVADPDGEPRGTRSQTGAGPLRGRGPRAAAVPGLQRTQAGVEVAAQRLLNGHDGVGRAIIRRQRDRARLEPFVLSRRSREHLGDLNGVVERGRELGPPPGRDRAGEKHPRQEA